MSDEVKPAGYTPGPWLIGNHDDWSLGYEGEGCASGRFILNAEGEVIGSSMTAHEGWDVPDSVDANARLIAAAPCLLEANINLVNFINELVFNGTLPATEATEACAESRTAIRKATTAT